MKKNLRKIVIWFVLVCLTITVQCAILGTAGEENPEEKAWNEVNGMEPTSLKNFLEVFPDGKYVDEAKLYLSLHNKIDAIRSKREKPTFVIPFPKLGERWEEWKKRRPDKDAVGIFFRKTDLGVTMSISSLLGSGTISFDSYQTPITPTGDGSIVAFRTGGLKLVYIGSIIIECAGEEVMYFGVIHGVGLVHLHGKGKVIMPDSKEVQLPVLQEVSGKVASVSMRTVAGPKSLFDTTLDLSEKDPKSTVVITLEGKPAQEFRILTADIVNIDGFTDLKGKHEMMGGLLILSSLQERLVGKHVVLKCRKIGRDDENDVYGVVTLEVSKKVGTHCSTSKKTKKG